MRGKWKRVSPRGSSLINCGERMNVIRVHAVFIPIYGAVEKWFNRSAPELAMFPLRSFSWYDEVRNVLVLWRFSS